MKCKRTECPNEIDRSSPKANNKKFCSPDCQLIHYKTVNAERMKAVTDRNNHKKYNQYAKGKEKCIICEQNGEEAWYFAVCHHVAQRHKIDEHTYKRMLGVDVSKGRLPERTKRVKRMHVFTNGTVLNLAKGKHRRFKKGDPRAGKYERSAETLERLKHKTIWKKRKSGTKKKAIANGVSKTGLMTKAITRKDGKL